MTITAGNHFRSLNSSDRQWVQEFRRRVAAADSDPLSSEQLEAMRRGLQDGVACHALEDMHETSHFKQLRLEALATQLVGHPPDDR